MSDGSGGAPGEQACLGLFCFIGAVPATDWLTGIALDGHGFIRSVHSAHGSHAV